MANEPANKVIYTMIGVSKFYDKKPVLKDIYLSYFYGAKIGVLGLNGSGKSSLLRILAGVDTDFLGKTILTPGHTVGFLEQEPRLDETKTVREIVEQGVQETVDLLNEFNRINEKFAEPMTDEEMNKLLDRQAKVQEKLDHLDAWDLDSRLEMAMDALRCPPGETPVNVLSGGERRRVALCRLLLQSPDILLLDEPTNHLDAESVAWLEHHLQRYEGTVIAVTHDRYFLDNVAGWILELDRGQGIPWKGNYSSWLDQKQKRLQKEEKSETERQKTLQRELEWIRMSPKGRHAKSKARISSYEELLSQETEARARELEIFIPPGPRLGKLVIEAEGVSKGYGDRLLIDKMSFALPPGVIVGVIGPNGAGKTTLFRMITGQEKPDSGTIRIAESVKLAYVDQSRDVLDPNKTIWEMISEGKGYHRARNPRGQLTGLCLPFQLFRHGPTEEGRAALRRRTEPRSPGADAQGGGERPAPRRADQRPRREHDACSRGSSGKLRRLRGRHQPRSLVPRPDRHPHPGLRRGQHDPLVRRQLFRIRGGPKSASRRRGEPATPDQVPPIDQDLKILSSGGIIKLPLCIADNNEYKGKTIRHRSFHLKEKIMKKTGLLFVSVLLVGLMSGCEAIKDATDITFTIERSMDFTIDESLLTTYSKNLDLNDSEDYRKYKGKIRDVEIDYVRYSITSNTGSAGQVDLYATVLGGTFASATKVAGPIGFAASENRPVTDIALQNKDYFENLLASGQLTGWAAAAGTNVRLALHVDVRVKITANPLE
jgi:energy-dependent translational throttle protein EttA